MIALITGTLKRKAADYLIVDVSGVGYQVQVPLSTLYGVPEPGGEVTLHIHTHLREDALSLFGFLTPSEKDMFLLLMSVSGIGPKLALAVLSSLPVNELCGALQSSDDSKLCAIPGIGRKTAARMVLELKDKIARLSMDVPGAAPSALGQEDVVSALVNLGYKRSQAEDAVRKVREGRPGMTLEQLIRDTLSILVKR
ncbi:MAG TPA: Holliday junction branch migration protein RuvA [Nitrospirota bacterium]|nr:Holliday junction branch migration protein RuvA [Nitrospirota bacterium]